MDGPFFFLLTTRGVYVVHPYPRGRHWDRDNDELPSRKGFFPPFFDGIHRWTSEGSAHKYIASCCAPEKNSVFVFHHSCGLTQLFIFVIQVILFLIQFLFSASESKKVSKKVLCRHHLHEFVALSPLLT